MEKEYSKRICEVIEEYNKLVPPSEKSAKFAEKLFMLIGEMQGHIIALENFKDSLKSRNTEKSK